jgi:hypothetical protein
MMLDTKQLKQLIRILNNALANPELFTDVDEDSYEFFDSNFHGDIKVIKNKIELMLDVRSEF